MKKVIGYKGIHSTLRSTVYLYINNELPEGEIQKIITGAGEMA